MQMILSIIIPVYNVEPYVERCLRSVEMQDIHPLDYEVVVVNDGSKDKSLDIVTRVATEFDNIRVFSQPNGGLSAARNAGMEYAKGEYFMFLDSDDWIAENCLGKIVKRLRAESPDAFAFCAATMFGNEARRRKSFPIETVLPGKDLLVQGIEFCAPFAIWKSKFLKDNELYFYPGIFHEDAEFTPRAYYLAEKVSLCNDLIYYVYQNPNSITRSINHKKSFDLLLSVCPSLSKFNRNVEDDYKFVFYNKISLLLNNAFYGIQLADKNTQSRFCDLLAESSSLFEDLIKSSITKYKIEGYLFKIFPRNALGIYKLLQLFNRK